MTYPIQISIFVQNQKRAQTRVDEFDAGIIHQKIILWSKIRKIAVDVDIPILVENHRAVPTTFYRSNFVYLFQNGISFPIFFNFNLFCYQLIWRGIFSKYQQFIFFVFVRIFFYFGVKKKKSIFFSFLFFFVL